MYKTLYSIQFDIEKYYKDFDTMKVIMQDIDQNIEIYTKNIIEIEIIIVKYNFEYCWSKNILF